MKAPQYILMILSLAIIGLLIYIILSSQKNVDTIYSNCEKVLVDTIRYTGKVVYPSDRGQGVILMDTPIPETIDNKPIPIEEAKEYRQLTGITFTQPGFDRNQKVSFNVYKYDRTLIAESIQSLSFGDSLVIWDENSINDTLLLLDLHAVPETAGGSHSKFHIYSSYGITPGGLYYNNKPVYIIRAAPSDDPSSIFSHYTIDSLPLIQQEKIYIDFLENYWISNTSMIKINNVKTEHTH